MVVLNFKILANASRPNCHRRFNVRVFLVFIFFALISFATVVHAQVDSGKVLLGEVLLRIEKKQNVKFFYKNDWIRDVEVKAPAADEPLFGFLSRELGNNGLNYLVLYDSQYVILFKGPAPVSSLNTRVVADTTHVVENQKRELYRLEGIVRDSNTGERIVGATVFAEEERKVAVTGKDGDYQITLPLGSHHIRITAVGKGATVERINLGENMKKDFEMFEQSIELNDIVISSQRADRNVTSTDMGQLKMDIKTLRTIPQFMGEVDVVKSILLLPGISTVGEGASGFNVRGGNVDQNLILLDDVPLFNSSHLFGFFSSFNPDFVKDFTLYKGAMPANYSGRISSVLDVKMKDGNPAKVSVSGGVGIISSRLMVEGPLGSDKTTFVIGGRFAYPDWLLKKVPDINVQRSSANFYDLNFRLRHQFNDRNSIYFSAYRSADLFKFAADTTYGWSTTNLALRWNTTISNRLYANATVLYSQYQNQISGLTPGQDFDAKFGIDTQGGKADFTYSLNSANKIDFGVNYTHYTFNNGNLLPGEQSSVSPKKLQEEYSIERGIYISDEVKVSPTISLHGGLRYSDYAVLGEADVALYDPNLPQSPSSVVGTKHFAKGEEIKKYSGWEPRMSVKISVSENSSVKLGYNRNLQYLQLISNTTAISPLDLWKSSNYYIKPQVGNQLSLGYFRNFSQNRIEASVEGFYKQIDNLVEYKNGANLFMNPLLESQLLNAKGEAYGAEFFVKKREGKLTGWISYTYSRSLRTVNGTTPEETLNHGQQYPSNFDKPHNVSTVANYAFTRRLSMSANFTYSTGRPITNPQSIYVIDGYAVAQFTDRNQSRIPDYHRLDLSFTIEESLKRQKKWKGSWTFSIYNVYGRANPYSVFFKPQPRGYQIEAYRLAVVGTVFPSITYNFKF